MVPVLGVTGHRPDKLGGYAFSQQAKVVAHARRQLQLLAPESVITGMALGWDQAIAIACLELRIPFIAAVPFIGQEGRWPPESRQQYTELLKQASYTHVVSTIDDPMRAMQQRNEWVVDCSGAILSLWNGSYGGTRNCVKYAQDKGVDVINTWDQWQLCR